MKKFFAAGLAMVTVLVLSPTGSAQTWTEEGDAGSLPAIAQITAGIGQLTTITGTISNTFDPDMYQIYLTGGGTFSATTVGQPGTLFDTQLFLFDATGRGVYANDDEVGGASFRSTLPAFHPLTPTTAGLYYLLVTPFNYFPSSGPPTMLNLIFPLVSPERAVVGPTGLGGASPITAYTGFVAVETGTYTIRLTGTEFAVPEPGTLALASIGMFGLLSHARRRRKG